MRIVHLVCTDQFAGVEQFVLRLAIAQAGSGHSVVVIGGDRARMADSLRHAGVRHRPAANLTQAFRALRRCAHADVVNSHMTAADAAAVLAFHRRSVRPVLVSTRHFARPRARLRPLGKAIETRLDAEISISHAVAEAIGVPSRVIHSGLPDAPAHAPAQRENVVLVAQRLELEKATDVALRAFAESALATQGWRLLVAGGGTRREQLEADTRELGIADAVHFLGPRTDVDELMRSASLLIAPCPLEGLGLTVLEAMRAGLPVVAAGAGGHIELLGGTSPHCLFPPGDAGAAAKSLRALACDEEARAALGAELAQRQAAEFSLARQQRATDAAYRAAIERAESTRPR